MTLAEKIQKDLTDAMRAKDELRLSVIRGIKSAITYKENEKLRKLDEPESIQLLQTLVKQRKESIDQFTKGNRNDLVEKGNQRTRHHRNVSSRRRQQCRNGRRHRQSHGRNWCHFHQANGRRRKIRQGRPRRQDRRRQSLKRSCPREVILTCSHAANSCVTPPLPPE